MMIKGWTVVGAGVLVFALLAQWAYRPRPAIGPVPDLRQKLGAPLGDWEERDLPIGKTEFLEKVSADSLQFDTYFYRAYSRPDVDFTLLVTYWRDQKYPPQMVAQHTPDRCWTMNGAVCEESRHHETYRLDDVPLPVGQWRRFRNPDGSIIYVVFWHRVGNRFFDYGERSAEMLNPLTFWREEANFIFRRNSEQYFYRITSNRPPEQLWADPGFQKLARRLRQIGLIAAPRPRPDAG